MTNLNNDNNKFETPVNDSFKKYYVTLSRDRDWTIRA